MTHGSRRVTCAGSSALRTALLTCSLALVPAASAGAQDVRIFRGPERELIDFTTDLDRPMIGVTTTSSSERSDTLGLRVESVREDSPAAKAGIKAGDRLQAINGVSLRADRADAGEDDYAGVLSRRLQRAVQATKPGESVTLRVLSGGATREVRLSPVKGSELSRSLGSDWKVMEVDEDRAVLGLSVASTGTLRDTLGIFVQSVVRDGPAEKAGVVEGERISAINGVSLRVSREDAEDGAVGAARAERLTRELAKLKAGESAELTVVSGGRSRTVRVTTVKASDLPAGAQRMFMLPDMGGMLRVRPDGERMPRVMIRRPDAPGARM